MNITIQIVGWNSEAHLKRAVVALAKIPSEEAVIRYIDNGSKDNSVAVVREALPMADIIELGKNTGFAAAHNVGFAKCTTPYVLTHDPDLVLEWEGIKTLLAAFQDEKVGAVQGKLLRVDGRIDSVGIVQTPTLNGKERGANEDNHGQYDERAKLLAVTGACGLYRLAAIRAVAHTPSLRAKRSNLRDSAGIAASFAPLASRNDTAKSEIFDEDFFSYKEDVDLGWRLNRAGWKVLYLPYLAGIHHRTLGKRGFAGWGLHPINIYKRLSSPRTYYSLRNYVWMIVKNVGFWQGAKHEILIDARLLLFFLFSLFYWPLFPVWFEILRGTPRMVRKRTIAS